MIPDTQFPHAIPPYRFPVNPPTVDPDTSPLVQVCINSAWLAYVIGALKSLTLQATWNYANQTELDAIQNRAQNLLAIFSQASNGCGLTVPDRMCFTVNFFDEKFGFVPAPGAPCPPTWALHTDWLSCFDGVGHQAVAIIQRQFDNATFVETVHCEAFCQAGFPLTLTVTLFYLGVQQHQSQNTNLGGGQVLIDDAVGKQCDLVLIDARGSRAVDNGQIQINNFGVCYVGDFPLSGQGKTCKFFDFTTSAQGFTHWVERPYGHWAAGGWLPDPNQVGNSSIYIGRQFDHPGTVTSINIVGSFGETTGNQLDVTNEFVNDIHVEPGLGGFSFDSGPINWNVDPSQRFLIVILNNIHHPTAMTITSVQVCSTAPVFD